MAVRRRTGSGPGRVAKALRTIAQRLSDVEEGISCAGTVLESTTFKTKKKAFLFVGPKVARLKLGPSIKEASRLAAAKDSPYQVGKLDWVAIALDKGDAPSTD